MSPANASPGNASPGNASPGKAAGAQSQPVYLVQGDDPTLVAEAARALIDELVGDADRSLVVEEFRGEEIDLAMVADACQTPPFLADRRIVVVRDIGQFAAEAAVPLVSYLEDPSPTTALVLVGGDGRVAPKLLAAVKDKGQLVAAGGGSGREAKTFVRDRLRSSPVRIDGAAESLIESHLGEDKGRLSALVDVLVAAYGEGARLGVDDIRPYLGQAGSVAPWDFTDAIDAGDAGRAIEHLHRLLDAGERHPLVVLATLHRHVQNLLRVDDPSIRTEDQAAEAMGLAKGRSTFPAKKALASARRYGSAGIASAVGLVADAELALKGAQDWPGTLVLEVLVARLCRLARSGGAPGARPPASGRRATPARR